MANRLPQDASSSIDGILYQYYSILNYCFDMQETDVLYIEKFGDISYGDINIEVKKYSNKLSDTHENLWKTMANWLNSSFKESYYNKLILLTTQEYTSNSTLVAFNNMNINEKFICLKAISDKHKKKIDDNLKKTKKELKKESQDKIIKYMDQCFKEENNEKFKAILSKMIILDSAPDEKELINSIASKYANNIAHENRLDYLRGLLGYVICPKQDEISKWQLKKTEFDSQCEKLTDIYSSLKKVFPYTKSNVVLEIETYEDYDFIKKIKDIKHDDEVIEEAVYDYVDTKRIITQDFGSGSKLLDEYNMYRNEEYRSYKREYRKACRNTCIQDLIKDSQNLYDTVTNKDAIAFMDFINNAPKKFRNGTLHIIADEDDKDETLVWKLKVNKDE